MTDSDAVGKYKRATVELLMRRRVGSVALDAEKPYTDVLESEWNRMTEDERKSIDDWVREVVSRPVAPRNTP